MESDLEAAHILRETDKHHRLDRLHLEERRPQAERQDLHHRYDNTIRNNIKTTWRGVSPCKEKGHNI